MISINNLTIEFSARPLFRDISFVVNGGERVALVGKNGAGKSTLLKTIAGMQTPTAGHIAVPREATVGYLPQVMNLTDQRTVLEEAELAFARHKELQTEVEQMTQELQRRTDYESKEYQLLIERFTHKTEHYELIATGNFHAETERTLMGLGFLRSDFERPTSEFSGGWRMRIELAKLLLQRPDVLLLDEPTNHLDIESIQWLENFLATRANAVILVSHDRAFINRVTGRTVEIECGRIYDYKVSYNQFVELRKERREQQRRAYENQQKMIQETEAFIERFRAKATKAVQVQSRIKQLAKVDRIEIDEEDSSMLRLKFPPAPRSGDFPLIVEDLKKQYGAHTVFSNVGLTLRRGEKVAFVGKNGEGKSTLVKCIMDEIDFAGSLKLGHNVRIGYFAQNQAMLLAEDLTVFETIDHVAVGDVRTKIRDLLGAFMFGGEASDKKVKVLSGGERSRLAMIRLLLEPVNLLILDEPTNHLDMRSKDVLKEAIRTFTGTAIIVSHDREFLDGLVSRVYAFGGGRVREHIGGIYDYLAQHQADASLPLPAANDSSSTPKHQQGMQSTQNNTQSDTQASRSLSYEQRKELNKLLTKLTKKVEEHEQTISETEAAIAIMEHQMASTTHDASLYERHARLKSQLEKCLTQWETDSEELEHTRQQLQ